MQKQPISTAILNLFHYYIVLVNLGRHLVNAHVWSRFNEIGDILQSSIHEINRKRQKFRLQLEQIGLLDNDIRFRNIKPLVSGGVDGAYAVDRLLGTDLLFAAAVGVEGINEENGKRVLPSHDVFVNPEKHNPENMIAARAIMLEM